MRSTLALAKVSEKTDTCHQSVFDVKHSHNTYVNVFKSISLPLQYPESDPSSPTEIVAFVLLHVPWENNSEHYENI